MKINKIRQLEEEEAIRVAKLAEEEAAAMLARLKAVEEEEAERRKQQRIRRLEQELYAEKLKNLKKAEYEAERLKQSHYNMINSKRMYTYTLDYESTADIFNDTLDYSYLNTSLEPLGITEEDLAMQCDELFLTSPIEFIPRKNSDIDILIANLIHDLQITIPIVHVSDSTYLVGSQRVNMMNKRDVLFVKRGVSTQTFQEFYLQNKHNLMRSLVIYMIKSGDSLEEVVDALVANKKIKNVTLPSQQPSYSRISQTSPNRSALN